MIALEHVTKSYRTPRGRRYVFRDLSLTVPPGKSIGLIGPNGAGKSTLMRLIGGMDQPDSGRVRTDGSSISWPVGLSGSFQGSMSGRDNVKFVCRVYGQSGAEMRRKVEFVEDFAAIGTYFDEPVNTYSSGMRSRLSFGLSMAFDFDYYLIDEVMSVGDASFRRKAAAAFAERVERSKVILVTHTMSEVERLCDVVLLAQKGQVTLFEDVKAGIDTYMNL
ncbi:Capsular polysaccharide ABC transporter, ATP-binding protein KpsT [plant metagenome]|uniref:Capsular polysaccharide ABC transporter, ATP-binding protein KpsT n=1 Tax=plant metagenome TaxID=1297885 RepID=A0A484NU67_9ZZZZ